MQPSAKFINLYDNLQYSLVTSLHAITKSASIHYFGGKLIGNVRKSGSHDVQYTGHFRNLLIFENRKIPNRQLD